MWYVQVFHASGESKSTARSNVAQKAVDALRPKIEAELEHRKAVKKERQEVFRADREDRLRRLAEKQAQEGEVGSCSSSDAGNQTSVSASEGTGDAHGGLVAGSNDGVNASAGEETEEAKQSIKGVPASQLLNCIRPKTSYSVKINQEAPEGHKYEASVSVDGTSFEGRGDSLGKAKALAAASALTSLIDVSFEYSPRKNFILDFKVAF